MPLADEIRKALSDSGRESEEVGKLLGITGVSVRRFRSGAAELSLPNLEKLAKILGLKIHVTTARKKSKN